jgi:hypothetical protein
LGQVGDGARIGHVDRVYGHEGGNAGIAGGGMHRRNEGVTEE